MFFHSYYNEIIGGAALLIMYIQLYYYMSENIYQLNKC